MDEGGAIQATTATATTTTTPAVPERTRNRCLLLVRRETPYWLMRSSLVEVKSSRVESSFESKVKTTPRFRIAIDSSGSSDYSGSSDSFGLGNVTSSFYQVRFGTGFNVANEQVYHWCHMGRVAGWDGGKLQPGYDNISASPRAAFPPKHLTLGRY
jgi:hypothetical protein